MNRRHTLALAAALLTTMPLVARAADYPEKPIAFIVPWPAGGTTDIIGRMLADAMSADLGKPIAVVNRVGAGGSLGTKAALDAPKDGYTVLVTTSGNQILTPLAKDVGYKSADFVPIGQVSTEAGIANVIYDFRRSSRVSPFLGLGVGQDCQQPESHRHTRRGADMHEAM